MAKSFNNKKATNPLPSKKVVPKKEPTPEPSEVSDEEMNGSDDEAFDEDPFASSDEDGSQLIGSDEDVDMDGSDDDDGSDDSDDSDDDKKVSFKDLEKRSRKLEQQQKQIEQEAEEELQIGARTGSGADVLDFVKSGESVAITDLTQVKSRIGDLVLLLENFNKEIGNQISRIDLLEELTQRCTVYYGYNEELTAYFFKLMSPQEAVAWFEANESNRPITLRTNTLKTHRRELAAALIDRGADVDPVGDWTREGLKVGSSSVPIGATPEYLAGHYLLQSASSFVPVLALNPLPGEKVLDMSAAPGGKATHIGQLMRNKGILFVNDYKKQRCASMIANIHRLGITNTCVINMDGRRLPSHLSKLDKILLDAPCSGSGIVARDASVKQKRTPKDFLEHSALQKELLAAAVDMVDANSRTGGIIVYSTCSVAVEENEEVVNHILKTRNVKLIELGLNGNIGEEGMTKFGEDRFDPSLKLTRRLYPHKHNMDGFFVAKFKKISNDIPERAKKDRRKDVLPKWDAETMAKASEGLLSFDDEDDVTVDAVAKVEKRVVSAVEGGAIKLSASGVKKASKSLLKNASKEEAAAEKSVAVPPVKKDNDSKKNIAVPQIWGKKQKKKLAPEEIAAKLAPKGQKAAASKATAALLKKGLSGEAAIKGALEGKTRSAEEIAARKEASKNRKHKE